MSKLADDIRDHYAGTLGVPQTSIAGRQGYEEYLGRSSAPVCRRLPVSRDVSSAPMSYDRAPACSIFKEERRIGGVVRHGSSRSAWDVVLPLFWGLATAGLWAVLFGLVI